MKEDKEVDLLDIIGYILNYLQKRTRLILLIFVVMTAIPSLYYVLSPKTYTSKITIISNFTVYTMVEQLSNPLIMSIKYNNDSVLANLIDLKSETIKNIVGIELAEVEPHPAERREGCTFSLELKMLNPRSFKNIENSFVDYYNQNSFIDAITKVKLEQLIALHDEIELQIKRLDSIQKMIPSAISKYQSNNALWSDLNLGSIYEQMALLKIRETDTKEKIDLIQEFKMINGFNIIEPSKGILFFSGLGFGLGFVLNAIVFLSFAVIELLERKKKGEF